MHAVTWCVRRWNALGLGIFVIATMHLAAPAVSTPVNEPWPALLSSEPAADPAIVLLQQRASGSLEKLIQSASAVEQPL
jgi:hypothetical protein